MKCSVPDCPFEPTRFYRVAILPFGLRSPKEWVGFETRCEFHAIESGDTFKEVPEEQFLIESVHEA